MEKNGTYTKLTRIFGKCFLTNKLGSHTGKIPLG